MVSTIDDSMPEPRFFIFFDSIMPPTASAATVTTRFSIIASLSQIERGLRCTSLGTHLQSNYDKSCLDGASEPCGNCCDTVYICSRFGAERLLRPVPTFIMPA